MQIPFHKTHTTNEEIESVVESIKSGWLTMGPKTIEFEEKFREYMREYMREYRAKNGRKY